MLSPLPFAPQLLPWISPTPQPHPAPESSSVPEPQHSPQVHRKVHTDYAQTLKCVMSPLRTWRLLAKSYGLGIQGKPALQPMFKRESLEPQGFYKGARWSLQTQRRVTNKMGSIHPPSLHPEQPLFDLSCMFAIPEHDFT